GNGQSGGADGADSLGYRGAPRRATLNRQQGIRRFPAPGAEVLALSVSRSPLLTGDELAEVVTVAQRGEVVIVRCRSDVFQSHLHCLFKYQHGEVAVAASLCLLGGGQPRLALADRRHAASQLPGDVINLVGIARQELCRSSAVLAEAASWPSLRCTSPSSK